MRVETRRSRVGHMWDQGLGVLEPVRNALFYVYESIIVDLHSNCYRGLWCSSLEEIISTTSSRY